MFYLGHISDVHLAPLPQPRPMQLFGKRITGYLNWQKHRANELATAPLAALMRELHLRGPDHIAITGDLVNLSLPQEFVNARQWLLDQGNPKDISLVFGNHDAYVRGALKQACQIFAPWLSSDVIWQKTTDPTTIGRMPEPKSGSSQSIFPYLRIRGNVAIIGVSSALATPPFFANGYVGRRQVQRLEKLCRLSRQQNLFTVILIHHPPLYGATGFHKKLWGIARLQRVIASSGAHLVLHGHTHRPTIEAITSEDRIIPVIGISSASQGFHQGKAAAGFNWLAIEYNRQGWQVVLSRYAITDHQNKVNCVNTTKLVLR